MNKLANFLSSVKVTVVLLIVLAALSIVGTVIPQQESPATYARLYGESTARLFHNLGFTHMYGSTWFVSMLFFLGLNLVVCSVRRIPKTWKIVKAVPALQARDYTQMPFRRERTIKEPADNWKDIVTRFLSSRFSKPLTNELAEGTVFFCQKTPWSRMGVYVVHGSVLLLFVGAIVGAVWGFKGNVNIGAGETINSIQLRGSRNEYALGFQIRCDDFSVEFYESGAPKEFRSDLTFLNDGKEVMKSSVRVNDPVSFRGITFYQSTYGSTLGDEVTFDLVNNTSGTVHTISGPPNQDFEMPDGKGKFRIIDFQSNLTSGGMNFGPGVMVHLMGREGHGRPFWVVKDFPELDKRRKGDFTFVLKSFKETYYTGLQANRDPGVWLVYLGFVAMLIGFPITFFLSHQSVWVQMTRSGNKMKLIVAGTAHRNRQAFIKQMERFWEDFSLELQGEDRRS
ncbi:MAG: cytochrome c biogenesis protein ResB [Deltaproteobacteria bacterium]|nr:cytochrome c biogenesis protein ResB [Deltaproteobacteria bacterium]